MSNVVHEMLGGCDTRATGNYRPSLEELVTPQDWRKEKYDPATGVTVLVEPELPVVTRRFCRGCGAYWGIAEMIARALAEKCHGEKIDYENGFFQTSGCLLCDGNRDEVEFILFDSLRS